MKSFTHPTINKTLICYKDGSMDNKYWRYLRSTLILEDDPQSWYESFQPRKRKFYTYGNFAARSHKGFPNKKSLFSPIRYTNPEGNIGFWYNKLKAS